MKTETSERLASVYERPREALEFIGGTAWWHALLLPKVLLITIVFAVPFVASIWISFHQWAPLSAEQPFVGLDNYFALMNDPTFWNAFINTAGFVAGMVAVAVPLGLLYALLLNAGIRGTSVYSTIIFLPVVTSWVVVSLIWIWLYNPFDGLINMMLAALGLPTYEWLNDPSTALFAVWVMSVWKQAPFHMVIFLAGLQGIKSHLYEAARVDGAGRWERFRHVTIPQLKPTIFFAVIIQIIFTARLFPQIYVMTSGGPATSSYSLVFYFFEQGFEQFNYGYASAIAVVLFVAVAVFSLVQQRVWGDSDGV